MATLLLLIAALLLLNLRRRVKQMQAQLQRLQCYVEVLMEDAPGAALPPVPPPPDGGEPVPWRRTASNVVPFRRAG
jgi:hypothetical protein